MSVLKPVLADLFRARWGKTPSDADLVLLLKKRPNVSAAQWAAVLEEYATEDERGYMPRPSSLLMRLPVDRRVCALCGGRGGVRARGAVVTRAVAERAGLDGRDFKALVSGDVHLRLAAVERLSAQGFAVQWEQRFIPCDACATEGETTISDYFSPSGRLAGYAEVAGFGRDGGPPERPGDVELVLRVVQAVTSGTTQWRG